MDPNRMERHPQYRNQAQADGSTQQSDDAGSASETGTRANPSIAPAAPITPPAISQPTSGAVTTPQMTVSPVFVAHQPASSPAMTWDYSGVQESLLAQSAEKVREGLEHFSEKYPTHGLERKPEALAYFKAVFDAYRRVRIVFSEEHAEALCQILSADNLSKLTIDHLELVMPEPSMAGSYAIVQAQDASIGMRLRALSGMLQSLNRCRKESGRRISVSLELCFSCRQEANDFHSSWIASRSPLYDCLRNSKLVTDVRIEKFQGKADREPDRIGDFKRPVSDLIPVLRSMKSLQRLALCDNDIDDGQAKELAEVLRKIDGISLVDLRRNPIGDAGKAALEQVRATRQTLTILY
jgi:hypothetical protein